MSLALELVMLCKNENQSLSKSWVPTRTKCVLKINQLVLPQGNFIRLFGRVSNEYCQRAPIKITLVPAEVIILIFFQVEGKISFISSETLLMNQRTSSSSISIE